MNEHEGKPENKDESANLKANDLKSQHEAEHKKHKVKHEHHKSRSKGIKKINLWQSATGILAILFLISLFTNGFNIKSSGGIGEQEVADEAVEYINENLLQGGQKATLKEIKAEEGFYNLKLDIDGREFDSYVTKNGKFLFPSAFDMTAETDTEETTPAAEEVPDTIKSDKPKVELFVMSHCPFGTQAEKGILPVAKLLGDKIDFSVKFVYYAMHGKKELDEQTLQYCIQKEQNEKFFDYMLCFLKDEKTDECLTETKIDKEKLDTCVEQTDKEFKITEQFNDKATWLNGRFPLFDIDKDLNTKYGVRGSPNLVINGKTVSSSRDSASYLKTICSSFNEQPEECSTELSSASPSAGFGFNEATAANVDATCG